jgi:hypothetical protein
MKITVDEIVDMQNRTKQGMEDAYKKGVQDEKARALPENLFTALLEYGIESGTIVESNRSTDKSDGCNWVQLRSTREGSEGIKCVEISFEENLMEIKYISVSMIEKNKL